MKTNREYRELAWTRLWADKWFGRLFGGMVLLNLCSFAIMFVLSGILGALGVDDWEDYKIAVTLNRVDVTVPVPNLTRDYIIQTSAATVLEAFIGYILQAIVAYGIAVMLLRCLKNEEEGYFKVAFGGFKDPLGMFWLFLRLALIYFGWLLAALLPLGAICALMLPLSKSLLADSSLPTVALMGVGEALGLLVVLLVMAVPFYRYRFAFLVKAEHPDWRAGACLDYCKRLMQGHKRESFRLDCSYWKAITLVLLLALLLVAIGAAVSTLGENTPFLWLLTLAGIIDVFALLGGIIVLSQYISVGQGFFYQTLKDGFHGTGLNGTWDA